MSEVPADSRLKIICADDEPMLLTELSRTLSTLGYEVLTAANGTEAFELIKLHAQRTVLVISDFSMPESSGFELRKKMLPDLKHIPFAILSGYISREEAMLAVELNISGFLEKPFEKAQLISFVSNLSKDRATVILEEDELLSGFVIETTALIDEMESLILSLEENPNDSEGINRIFACAHTIKGTSGFFKPDTIHKFMHRYEDFLSKFKKYPDRLNPKAVNVLLKGLDIAKRLLTQLSEGSSDGPTIESLLPLFDEVVETTPSKSVDSVHTEAKSVSSRTPKATTEELRVSVSLLNQFMEKSGEMTVLRNMINKILHVVEVEHPGDPNISTLVELLNEQHKVNSFIQIHVADLRKISLKQVFKPLARSLRDLCMNLKKQIRLEISGEDLRVDHTIVEALNKCLIHIIRNSADHGIESASERTKVGKNTNGAITITAQEVKEEVIIRIQDDGRGIDPLRIKSKAIEKQIVSAQEADQMSDSQLRMLIFEPGFSTAEQVTDVSGRGVGTDMVKSTIVSMGGHIELNSEVGKGTEFIFRLPIPKSVLIISSLLVKDKDRTVAIPQDCVTRIISLSDDTKMNQIRSLGTTLVFQDQDRLIPVLSLSKILNSQFSAGQNSDLNETSFSKLVCVRSKNGPYCIQVDEVLNIEDTVVKQVGKWLRSVSTYLGVTFLADGRIGPILDIDGIAQKMCFEPLAANKIETSNPGSSQTSSADSKFVLLFDLGTDCTYGAMQTEIFRLEVIDTSEIQHSGNQSVVIYRGQTMPLISLSGALNIGNDCPNNSHSADQNKLQILVVQISGKFHGFIVRSIGDFVEVQSNDNTLELESLNQKIYIINSKTVTLLSLHHYISD